MKTAIISLEKSFYLNSGLGLFGLPYGVLGLTVHNLVVAKMLEQIFEFRRRKLAKLFG